ncbi:DNA mismatch repair protein [Flavobacterium sp. Sd200]|uniref:MutS-related protein n=1 Tax=Flavobacterium sp. Sd200 TaxID=2692211 RepID=UPI001369F91B|nr:DNA mismatch repair protein [Flavobacterium sp. Sd200]MXN90320.1 DNA mismatch repair protein [Flavobacterium sp. Sd200]
MTFYSNQKETFSKELKQLTARYNIIGTIRFIVAFAFFILVYYKLTSSSNFYLTVAMIACVAVFLILIKFHTAISKKKIRAAALVNINENELDYLEAKSISFEDGAEFADYKHPYVHDLDIFGSRSLFHNLNRTETYKGKERLAALLKNILPQPDIILNQEAIKELASKPEWRQEIMACGKTNKDSAQSYNKLLGWIEGKVTSLSQLSAIIAYASPVVLLSCLTGYFITDNSVLLSITSYLLLFNIIFMLRYTRIIKNEITYTGEIHDIIYRYGQIIEQIEQQHFESKKLIAIQDQLTANNQKASSHIKKLALLFSRMDIVNNLFGALLLNSVFLFHYHTLKSLVGWKQKHAHDLPVWLNAIAEVEALNSLANFYYNNPDFCFPELNTDFKISFTDLGHPLIKKDKRVGNSINFDPAFTILTGSNMSGKSTFLRSLGINMVLSGIGSVVCAANAIVHPLPVLVSMRLSDSLSDSESYFFAEIKRLREIMDALKGGRAFVLLDEILRGTNSDDKRTGTIKVVKRMIGLNAIGAIATHDIEVCNTSLEYPEILINRCFEVQIVDNELYFDYCLRNGICRNKSATFIMEKMGVV